MEQRDALGRRRQPDQNRGLRPLFPRLDENLRSRSVRLAMSSDGWALWDHVAAESTAPTRPRALGEWIERRLASGTTTPPAEPPRREGESWQAWQAEKERRLLRLVEGRMAA